MKYETVIPKSMIHKADITFSDIQEQIIQEQFDCHENVLKEVLRQLLKREPVPEDAKRLTRYEYEGKHGFYELGFDGIMIGRVVYGSEMYNYSVNFEPVKELKE